MSASRAVPGTGGASARAFEVVQGESGGRALAGGSWVTVVRSALEREGVLVAH